MANGEANSSNASLLPTPWWWRFLIAMAVCGVGGATFAAQYFRNSWDGSEGFARIQAGIGAICLFGIAACFSRNLRAVRWKTIFWGVGLQVFLAIFILKLNINGFRPGYELFQAIATGVT